MESGNRCNCKLAERRRTGTHERSTPVTITDHTTTSDLDAARADLRGRLLTDRVLVDLGSPGDLGPGGARGLVGLGTGGRVGRACP